MSIKLFSIIALSVFTSYVAGLINWIIVILGIGFLIFVHELGHFLLAKYAKVKVEAFALGFGAPIFRKRWGETEYRINILPLGGYVKLAGEIPGEGTTGAPYELTSKPPGQRALVFVAGVAMNALFGLLGVIFAFQYGIRFVSPTIGMVLEGSPAWKAGLQKGDEILEANGEKINSFNDLAITVAFARQDQKLMLRLRRNAQVLDCQVIPQYDPDRGFPTIGVAPQSIPKIRIEGEPWTIVNVGDRLVHDGNELYEIVYALATNASPTAPPIELTVKRGEAVRTVTLQPEFTKVRRVGITPAVLTIGNFRPGSLAESSGMRIGDTIRSVDGQPIYHRTMLATAMQKSSQVTLAVVRNNQNLSLPVRFTSAQQFLEDIYFVPDLYIGEVMPNSPASRELQAGDKILAIDGEKLTAWADISRVIINSKAKPLTFHVERSGQLLTVTITPQEQQQAVFGSIEMSNRMTEPKRYNILQSCYEGVKDAQKMVMQIFLMLKGLFNRSISSKNLGGPVAIFDATYKFLQFGLGEFIYFLALISINLAVLNLLPIPVLDGGHLLFVALEKLRGKPVPEKVMIWSNYAGLLFLLSLIVYVTINDICRLIGL